MLDGFRVALAGDVVTDADSKRLSGFRFEAGPTLLTGDVVQDADGLLTGQLQLASPNVTTAAALAMIEATGSANAAIALSAANGQQAADINGRIENLRAEYLVIGSADIAATLRDLFGTPALDGTVTARAVTAGDFTVDRLDAKATQSGETTSFTVDATMESDRALANAGITPLRASARGSLSGRTVTLDSLSAEGRGGLQVTGSLSKPQFSGTVSTGGAG